MAVGAVGWILALTYDQALLLPVTAVGQLVACTAVEVATTPEPDATLAIGLARIDGKPGFVCAFSF